MIFLLLVLFLFLPRAAHAGNDIAITCNQHDCIVTPALPLFSEKYLYPGLTTSQTLVVTNTYDHNCHLILNTQGSADNRLSPQIIITINHNTETISRQSLSQLVTSSLDFGTLAPDTTTNYLWQLSLSSDLDNSYQNLASQFDLRFNFTCDEPSASPTATSNPVSDPESRILLNELMPNPAQGNEWVEIYNDNDTSFTLKNWKIKKSSDGSTKTIPDITLGGKSFYVFDLGTDRFLSNDGTVVSLLKGDEVKNTVPNYGKIKNKTSYSRQGNGWCFTNLSPGIVNTACLEALSNTPQVLGVATTPTPVPSIEPAQAFQAGLVAGATTCSFYWLPMLYLISFVINLLLITRSSSSRSLFVMIFISAIFFVVDYLIQSRSCCFSFSFLCRFYWLGHILGLVLPLSSVFLPKLGKITHG